MISAVLDTNVIISGVLFGGLPGKLLQFAARDQFQLLISDAILHELTEVLKRPKFKIPLEFVSELRLELNRTASLVITRSKIDAIKADPADNRILECAYDGRANFIVTGDRELLQFEIFRKIKIVSVSEFMKIIEES